MTTDDDTNENKARGDSIDAQHSQGFIHAAHGPVSQNFGEQTTINSGGGDVAGRDIDNRQGEVFVDGNVVNQPGWNVSGDVYNVAGDLRVDSKLARRFINSANASPINKARLKTPAKQNEPPSPIYRISLPGMQWMVFHQGRTNNVSALS